MMAKALMFNINGSGFSAEPVKIERKKLYGYSKTFACDEDGAECETANLDEGPSGIIPKGGLGMGILSPEGLWVERAALKAVNAEGRDAPLLLSSYDTTINLARKMPVTLLLNYCITSFYALSCGNDFLRALGGDIYMFDYCYRASYEPSTAFVLANDEGVFMLVGYEARFDMLSLREEASLDEEEDEAGEDEEIDFSMM
jgi:hypothetical protein